MNRTICRELLRIENDPKRTTSAAPTLLAITSFCFLVVCSHAAAFEALEWDRKLNWTKATTIAALAEGDLVVAGSTRAEGVDSTDMWVLKVSTGGAVLWEKTFGGDGDESARTIVALPDGGLVVVGSTKPSGSDRAGVWVLRLDREGNALWDKSYDAVGPNGATLLSDGGLAIVGGGGTNKTDVWVLRLDLEGNHLWSKFVTHQENWGTMRRLEAVAPVRQKQSLWDRAFRGGEALSDLGIAAVGSWSRSRDSSADAWVLRFDSEGNILWDRTYGSDAIDQALGIAASTSVELAVVGWTARSWHVAKGDAWLVKLDEEGSVLWENTYGGDGGDGASFIAELPNDELAVVGHTTRYPKKTMLWAFRLDDEGSVLWEGTHKAARKTVAEAAAVLPGGGIAVVGWTSPRLGAIHAMVWIVRLGDE